jgi:hypothetical protein
MIGHLLAAAFQIAIRLIVEARLATQTSVAP